MRIRVNRGYLGLGLFESTLVFLYQMNFVMHYTVQNWVLLNGRNMGSTLKANGPTFFQSSANFSTLKRVISFFAKNCGVKTFWVILLQELSFLMGACNFEFVFLEGLL